MTKQSFLRQKDSIVILLCSVSQFDITSSIISDIIRFSLEVVYIVAQKLQLKSWVQKEANMNLGQ